MSHSQYPQSRNSDAPPKLAWLEIHVLYMQSANDAMDARALPLSKIPISLWWRYPGRKSFHFIMFVLVRLYSLLVHLVVGVQEAFHMANTVL